MKRYKSNSNRDQLSFIPMCLDDMISPDNEVRAIDAIVDSMDIQAVGFTYSEPKETGCKPYNPVANENQYMYKKRKQTVEHPFGTVKRTFGFSYFLTRGTESVRAESLMHFLVYNIKRKLNSKLDEIYKKEFGEENDE